MGTIAAAYHQALIAYCARELKRDAAEIEAVMRGQLGFDLVSTKRSSDPTYYPYAWIIDGKPVAYPKDCHTMGTVEMDRMRLAYLHMIDNPQFPLTEQDIRLPAASEWSEWKQAAYTACSDLPETRAPWQPYVKPALLLLNFLARKRILSYSIMSNSSESRIKARIEHELGIAAPDIDGHAQKYIVDATYATMQPAMAIPETIQYYHSLHGWSHPIALRKSHLIAKTAEAMRRGAGLPPDHIVNFKTMPLVIVGDNAQLDLEPFTEIVFRERKDHGYKGRGMQTILVYEDSTSPYEIQNMKEKGGLLAASFIEAVKLSLRALGISSIRHVLRNLTYEDNGREVPIITVEDVCKALDLNWRHQNTLFEVRDMLNELIDRPDYWPVHQLGNLVSIV